MNQFQPKRVHCAHKGQIAASPDQVFRLACPTAEYEWIDGWQCNLIYSESGGNEEGCIFTEDMSAPFLLGQDTLTTTWVTTLYDPEERQIHFCLVTDRTIALYKFRIGDERDGKTSVALDYTLTALNEAGNRAIGPDTEAKLQAMVTMLVGALKHYCETGEMLKAGDAEGLHRSIAGLVPGRVAHHLRALGVRSG
jgi:hypothetical protein